MVVHGYLALQKHGFHPPYQVHGGDSPDFQPRGSVSPYILWLLLCVVRVLKQSIAMDRKAAPATGATRLTNLDWVAAQTEQQFLPLNDSQASGTSAHRNVH